MTYSELITSIENSDVESIKISSSGKTAKIKLKSSKIEKEVEDFLLKCVEEHHRRVKQRQMVR